MANWIAGAIKHPGREKKAAKAAGVSTQTYMQEHKGDSGSSGAAARLGLRLSGMSHDGGRKPGQGHHAPGKNKP